jgi:hypothetical protein
MEQMNIKEELTKHKLLSNYLPNKTIKENIESMTIKDGEVEENILPGLARSSGKKFIPVFDDIIKFATARGKQPIMVLDAAAQGGKRVVTDGADLLKMIKAGSIDATNLARVNIGMFKAAGVVDDTLKALASDIVKQKEFIKNYSQLAKSPAKLKATLRQKGYSEAGADALIAEIKGTKGWGGVKPKTGVPGTKTVKTSSGKSATFTSTIGAVKDISSKAASHLINGIKNYKWNWARVLKWAAGIGLTAAAIWYICYKLDLFPDGMPKQQPKTADNTGGGNTGGGNTGGGNTGGGTPTKYTPCTSFPMVYGCKSDQIREVQSCLGMSQDLQTGNFGPKTMAALGGLKELTKEKYDAIIAKCKGTDVKPNISATTGTTTGSTTTLTGTTTGSTLPPITPPAKPAEPVMDKNRLQELLSSEKLVVRRRGKVVVWKGPKLSGPDYYILSKSLEEKGYTEVRQRETGDRDDEDITMKYKWKKLD